MAGELGDAVAFVGVNEVGMEAGNPAITEDRATPWLQDEADVDAWGLWGVTFRDVWVLDPENRLVAIYNLTEHDLREPETYDELKSIIAGVTR